MKKGFTLIELLVVVLIIGILSAVALPQYQRTVLKARTAEMNTVAKAFFDAEQRYKLANGEWSINIDDLDIAMPYSSIVVQDTGAVGPYTCYKLANANLVMCLNKASYSGISVHYGEYAKNFAFFYPDSTNTAYDNTTRHCWSYNSKYEKICASFGGTKYSTSGTRTNWTIP